MIDLITNAPQFHNDIAEEIRLFLGITEISFTETPDPELICKITLESDRATCELIPLNIRSSIPYEAVTEPLEKKRREKRAVKLAAYEALKQVFMANTPWGSLTGIRPTKLYREIAYKRSETDADEEFAETFSVSPEKIALVKRIHSVQTPIIRSAQPLDFDVYLGIPYCKTRCVYCSFGSELYKKDGQLREYLDYIKEEITGSAEIMNNSGYRLRCSYFGGGTPTVLTAELLDELLDHAEECYGGFGSEFTVEAGRPDTITREKLIVLKKHNISRISINPQTMNPETLKVIGRSHTPESIVECYRLARELGFENINMDVIAGLPGEDAGAFERTLEQIEKMRPDSLTVHTLALKKSSRLIDKLEEYPLPDASETEKMVSLGASCAASMGMLPYYMYRQKYMSGNLENVGYCRPGCECVYNIDMMEETVSVMAHGAHTISKRVYASENRVERIANPKDIPTYFTKIPSILESKRGAFALTSI